MSLRKLDGFGQNFAEGWGNGGSIKIFWRHRSRSHRERGKIPTFRDEYHALRSTAHRAAAGRRTRRSNFTNYFMLGNVQHGGRPPLHIIDAKF